MTIRTSIAQATRSVMGALNPQESENDIISTLHSEQY